MKQNLLENRAEESESLVSVSEVEVSEILSNAGHEKFCVN